MIGGISIVCALFALFFAPVLGKNEIGCRNEANLIVDWFYLYKLPGDVDHQSDSGLMYVYMTSEMTDPVWMNGDHSVNQLASSPGHTWAQLQNNETAVVMYNDEPPVGSVDGLHGHTKGVVGAGPLSGFWMIHSVPKYPPTPDAAYEYPATGRIFGQSFVCITLPIDQIDEVGFQLMFNEPHVYFDRFPEPMVPLFPHLIAVSQKERIKQAPFWRDTLFRTFLNHTEFRSFAKSGRFAKELYEEWLAPVLAENLLVESWSRGTGKLGSDCTKQFKVYNIRNIDMAVANTTFASQDDHSKWTVSEREDSGWICVGDINRMEHQKKRGGGTLCQNRPVLAAVYRNMVTNTEPCPRN